MDVEQTIRNLQKRGFQARYFETKEACADYIAETVKGTTVGFGGSVTARDMGLYELLENNGK